MLVIDIHLRAEVEDEAALRSYWHLGAGALHPTPEAIADYIAAELGDRLFELARTRRVPTYEVKVRAEASGAI